MADRQQPGAKTLGVRHLPDRPPGDEERFLDEVLGPVGVAGLQVEPGEQQPGRPADELLERRSVLLLSSPDQHLIRFVHAAAPINSENVLWTPAARGSSKKS